LGEFSEKLDVSQTMRSYSGAKEVLTVKELDGKMIDNLLIFVSVLMNQNAFVF